MLCIKRNAGLNVGFFFSKDELYIVYECYIEKNDYEVGDQVEDKGDELKDYFFYLFYVIDEYFYSLGVKIG